MKKFLLIVCLLACSGLEARRCCGGGGAVFIGGGCCNYGTPYQAYYPRPYAPPCAYWGAPSPYWYDPYYGYPYPGACGYPYGGAGVMFQMNFR